jgi:hypothetical protein
MVSEQSTATKFTGKTTTFGGHLHSHTVLSSGLRVLQFSFFHFGDQKKPNG